MALSEMWIKQTNQAVPCKSHIKMVKETISRMSKFVLHMSCCKVAEKSTLEKCLVVFFLVYLPNFIFALVNLQLQVMVSKLDSVSLPLLPPLKVSAIVCDMFLDYQLIQDEKISCKKSRDARIVEPPWQEINTYFNKHAQCRFKRAY